MSQFERFYWLDAMIRAGNAPSLQTARQRWEIKERTFYADIKYLRDRLDAPIAFDRRRGGYVYTQPNYHLPFLAMTDREADSLRRILLAAHASMSPADAAAVQHLSLKLSPYIRRLPVQGIGADPHSAVSEWFDPGFPTASAEATLSDTLLGDVRRAIDERRRLHLTYYGAHSNAVSTRIVQPYMILNWRGELYLIARCETKCALRDFYLPRIRAHTLLDPPTAFTVPADWNPQQYLYDAFTMRRGEPPARITVRFSPLQSRWVRERKYHPSQEMETEADGSVRLTLTVAGLADVKRWLLGFGADVEVLEPQSLRVELAEEAQRLQKMYARPVSPATDCSNTAASGGILPHKTEEQ